MYKFPLFWRYCNKIEATLVLTLSTVFAFLINRMDYYLNIRDIQMLGMLSCVLAHPSLPDSFKPPKIHPKPDVITSSKSFTYGSSPHCADITYQVRFHR